MLKRSVSSVIIRLRGEFISGDTWGNTQESDPLSVKNVATISLATLAWLNTRRECTQIDWSSCVTFVVRHSRRAQTYDNMKWDIMKTGPSPFPAKYAITNFYLKKILSGTKQCTTPLQNGFIALKTNAQVNSKQHITWNAMERSTRPRLEILNVLNAERNLWKVTMWSNTFNWCMISWGNSIATSVLLSFTRNVTLSITMKYNILHLWGEGFNARSVKSLTLTHAQWKSTCTTCTWRKQSLNVRCAIKFSSTVTISRGTTPLRVTKTPNSRSCAHWRPKIKLVKYTDLSTVPAFIFYFSPIVSD